MNVWTLIELDCLVNAKQLYYCKQAVKLIPSLWKYVTSWWLSQTLKCQYSPECVKLLMCFWLTHTQQASVLQHAAENIYRLNQERERLLQQNASLRMMLSKYWSSADQSSISSDVLTENRVNKATSPLSFDDERAAGRELEQIFATQKELQTIKMELERERALRRALENRCRPLKDQTPSEEEDEIEESEMSEEETYKSKRPRTTRDPSPRNNLDIIVRAIRQIEGDAFSRSTTPTCATQERTTTTSGTFRPISAGGDSSRVSPVTPVCAS